MVSSLRSADPTPRLGLFLQMDGAPGQAQFYERAIELIVAAEALGFHSARVTQHHFGERYGRLAAPLPFLAAAGRRTRRIHLGTVVVTLPLEQPLRLAEEAAVTDLLLQGRLELGLGSGLNQEIFAIFDADFARRREQLYAGIAYLQRALRGDPLDAAGSRLQPPAPDLLNRLWYASMSAESAEFAARNGLGLLLGRFEVGSGPLLHNQARTAAAYRAALGHHAAPARIAAARTIYPANDRNTAERELLAALAPLLGAYVRSGFLAADATPAAIFERLHILHGSPEQIARMLAAEHAQIGWSELLVQVDPGDLPHAQALRALERVAREVAPLLTPATAQ